MREQNRALLATATALLEDAWAVDRYASVASTEFTALSPMALVPLPAHLGSLNTTRGTSDDHAFGIQVRYHRPITTPTIHPYASTGTAASRPPHRSANQVYRRSAVRPPLCAFPQPPRPV